MNYKIGDTFKVGDEVAYFDGRDYNRATIIRLTATQVQIDRCPHERFNRDNGRRRGRNSSPWSAYHTIEPLTPEIEQRIAKSQHKTNMRAFGMRAYKMVDTDLSPDQLTRILAIMGEGTNGKS